MSRPLAALLLFIATAYAEAEPPKTPSGDAELPIVKLSPALRVQAPSSDEAVNCEQLSALNTNNEAQATLLARRKRECLKDYEAFIPGTGLR